MFMPFGGLGEKKKPTKTEKTAYENGSCEPSKTTYCARQLIKEKFLKALKMNRNKNNTKLV